MIDENGNTTSLDYFGIAFDVNKRISISPIWKGDSEDPLEFGSDVDKIMHSIVKCSQLILQQRDSFLFWDKCGKNVLISPSFNNIVVKNSLEDLANKRFVFKYYRSVLPTISCKQKRTPNI
eukprot:TRINITY_DN6166_c0_g2_i1.p1 TRINITY_DN6166_c0_g2~~TRINITY_DN6166_c0_g2_i1.p1  ORF type:complete len:121 (-),score=25.29 TRINITY_DN6166_c0_g2_i1:253-615(-)